MIFFEDILYRTQHPATASLSNSFRRKRDGRQNFFCARYNLSLNLWTDDLVQDHFTVTVFVQCSNTIDYEGVFERLDDL